MPAQNCITYTDTELVEMEIMPYYSPIAWGNDRQSRLKLFQENGEWLDAHPFRPTDETRIVVEREIRLAIHAVLNKTYAGTEQEVAYETVLKAIRDDTRITGADQHNCIQMLGALWGRMAHLLDMCYTKPTPADT